MVVRVFYHPECDPKFQTDYHNEFLQWINNNPSHTVQNDETIEFNEAVVQNGLHKTTSLYDPDPTPHATVRLSNAALRQQKAWYVLHWRPNGGKSSVLPEPDDEPSHAKRKQTEKARRQRRQQRKKDMKDKDKDKDGPAGGSGAPTKVGAQA